MALLMPMLFAKPSTNRRNEENLNKNEQDPTLCQENKSHFQYLCQQPLSSMSLSFAMPKTLHFFYQYATLMPYAVKVVKINN